MISGKSLLNNYINIRIQILNVDNLEQCIILLLKKMSA